MLFFTSDTHFGSNHAIIRENRAFKNYKKFDKYVISLWNKQTRKDDIIFHLGDFINYNHKDNNSWQKTLNYIKKIHAHVVLIIGNHEERLIESCFDNDFEKFKSYCLKLGFYDVKKEEYLSFNNTSFYLNHYPINHKVGFQNLFGHTHRVTGLWKSFGINVGCDLNYYSLYSEQDILKIIKMKKKFWDNDPNVII